jgi:hypothetical protein
VGEVDAFFSVFGLLEGEDVVIEELVQLLVGEVDAQLLEAVEFEVLKAKNIEDTNEFVHVFARIGRLVDAVDQPRERTAVQRFSLGKKTKKKPNRGR